MVYTWLAIIVLLIFVEAATVNLTTIWFVVSGIVAMLLSFFVESIAIQFAVFVVVGILLLLTTRKALQKFIHEQKVFTNFDRIIGMKGIITEEVSPNHSGAVKVDGKHWTCVSTQIIPVGRIVQILAIDGVKLKVKEMEE